MTGVISARLVLVPSTKASALVHGSWVRPMFPSSTLFVPQVRSLVVDRSSSSLFVLMSVSVAALSLVGLPFRFSESALMSSVAVPAPLTLFALGLDFFAWGSVIGLLSQKRFAR